MDYPLAHWQQYLIIDLRSSVERVGTRLNSIIVHLHDLCIFSAFVSIYPGRFVFVHDIVLSLLDCSPWVVVDNKRNYLVFSPWINTSRSPLGVVGSGLV